VTASRLVVRRHGQTAWNAEERMQGQVDIPLDATGLAQARAIAPELAALRPTALYTSDLSRARQTAEALSAITGLVVREDKRLREIDTGSISGLTRAEFLDRYPELRINAGPDDRRGGDGESERQVAMRMAACLTDIARAHDDGTTVVAASHGVSARVGVCALVGLPTASWRALGGLGNASYVVVGRYADLDLRVETPAPPGRIWRIVEWGVGDAARRLSVEPGRESADELPRGG
jgi:glucosyl-3-phosphoglycerate phosphatase